MPFIDGVFSKVLFSHIIDHLLTPEKALREINKVLTEKGSLLCITPNASSYQNKMSYALRMVLRGFLYGTYCLPKNQEIRTALESLQELSRELEKGTNHKLEVHELDHVHEFGANELVNLVKSECLLTFQQDFTGFHLISPILYVNDVIGQIWTRITIRFEFSSKKIKCSLLTDMYCLAQKSYNWKVDSDV